MQRSRLTKGIIIAASSFGAILLAGLATLYLLSSPAASAPPVAQFHECRTLHCGPFRLTDCVPEADGPLLVFSRFPERFLGDCGSMGGQASALLCSPVYTIRNSCTASGTSDGAFERTLEAERAAQRGP